MLWSINIGRIAGTAIRIHITFLLFLGWIFLASWYSGGAQAAWSGLAFMILLFACVLTTAAAFLPVPEDPAIPLADQGGGARQNEGSLNGLQLPFPAPVLAQRVGQAFPPAAGFSRRRPCTPCLRKPQRQFRLR